MGPSFQMSFAAAVALVAAYEFLRRPLTSLASGASLKLRPLLYAPVTAIIAGPRKSDRLAVFGCQIMEAVRPVGCPSHSQTPVHGRFQARVAWKRCWRFAEAQGSSEPRSTWKRQEIDGLGDVFSGGPDRAVRITGRDQGVARQDRGADRGQRFFGEGSAMSRIGPQGHDAARSIPALPLLEPAMQGSAISRDFLLRPKGESPENLAADAPHRRVVPAYPFYGRPDGPPVAAGRRLRRPSSCAAPDASHGPGSHLSGAANQHAACSDASAFLLKGIEIDRPNPV